MSEARLGRIGLGCASLGNLYRERSDDEAAAVLEAAWEAGVRYFDTAPHYGLGLSERRLGRFLAGKPRDEYVISTKVGRLLRPDPDADDTATDDEGFAVSSPLRRVWDLSPEGLRTSLEESLERLGLDRVDIVLLHDPERSGRADAVETGMAGLAALRDDGLATYVGCGSMTPETLLAAVETEVSDLVMVANRYTLLDQGAAPAVLEACDRTGTRVVAAAVFNSGLLAVGARAGATYDYEAVPPEVLARTERIEAVCREHDVDLATAAVHYPLLDLRVTTVVVGADTPDQIRRNVARLDEPVPGALWAHLAREDLVPQYA